MQRRNFLQRGTLAFGLLPFVRPSELSYENDLLPGLSDVTIDLDEAVWVGLFGRFARAVGANVASSLITDYLKRRVRDRTLRQAVTNTNRNMAEDGFPNLRDSTVYVRRDGTFGYTARANNGLDQCVPVFSPQRRTNAPTTMLEGPAIATLAPVAEQFRNKREAADWLMPVRGIYTGVGSFTGGYARPNVYESKNALVKVNYANTGRGRGVGTVSLSSKNGRINYDVVRANINYG